MLLVPTIHPSTKKFYYIKSYSIHEELARAVGSMAAILFILSYSIYLGPGLKSWPGPSACPSCCGGRCQWTALALAAWPPSCYFIFFNIFRAGFEELARAVGLSVLLWRAVPVDSSCLGNMAAILFYFILFNIFRAGFEELARAVGLSVLLWGAVPVESSCLGSMAAILFILSYSIYSGLGLKSWPGLWACLSCCGGQCRWTAPAWAAWPLSCLFYLIQYSGPGLKSWPGLWACQSCCMWQAVPVDSSCQGSMAAILFYFIFVNNQGRV
jgi:hypothetical protein